jgi:hypothetical protein
MSAAALDSSRITTIAVGATVALVVIGLLLGLVISALIGRVLILAVVVVLGVVVWQQRSSIQHKLDKCQLSGTYFGVHWQAPKSVVERCQKIAH